MIYQRNRVEWNEENALLIAERRGKKIEIWARDPWEVHWYRTIPTTAQLAKAKRLFERRKRRTK
jgi:hypothetical protein